MDEPRIGNLDASARVEAEDRLDSWKRIATYLKRDVSTVQRWERRESMPVHRHQHDKLGSVFAFRSELDAWWKTRQGELAGDDLADSNEIPLSVRAESEAPPGRSHARSQNLAPLAAAALALAVAAIGWYAVHSDLFWRNPLAEAKFSPVLDLPGQPESAAISRDGKQFAFVAERDGKIDAWSSAINSGRYKNLTGGRVSELINPATRTLGFSADSQFTYIWTRQAEGFHPTDVNILSTPTTTGGSLQLYLAGAAELDTSHDGRRIVYHTTAPGDPLFVRDLAAAPGTADARIYAAPEGLHCHFPVWSPDDAYVYFVRGVPPDEWDVWRVRATGADLERITAHNSRVSYPVLLDRRTLLYLASDAEWSGPWLYAMDVERRVPHRISLGVETFTSLAASSDGLHLVATVSNPRTSIWSMKLENGAAASAPTLLSPNGSSARFVEHGIVYLAESANGQSLWKTDDGARTEIWSAAHGRIVGAPAVSSDRRRIALPVEQEGRSKLYVTDANGSLAHVLSDALPLRGDPGWAPDGQSIAIAALHDGKPNLTRVFLNGAPPIAFTSEYSIDPAWSPGGQFLVYTGNDVGTTFPLRAATADGHPYPLPGIMLTRGARRVTFLPNTQTLVILTGGIGHKNVGLLDLATGEQRALAELPADFNIRDFDISSDGSQLVFERVEANSRVALIERKP